MRDTIHFTTGDVLTLLHIRGVILLYEAGADGWEGKRVGFGRVASSAQQIESVSFGEQEGKAAPSFQVIRSLTLAYLQL